MLPGLRVGLRGGVKVVSNPPETGTETLPQSAYLAYLCGIGRVTDGARTRDLRSHNPMLYLLSYGHQARKGFYQRKGAGKARCV